MARLGAVLFGACAGAAVGWMAAQGYVRRHREDLFSSRPLRRLAALGTLAAGQNVETIQVLRDYLSWERHPVLRRRAHRIIRRMEAALG